jgi:hypothetical protein
MAPMKFPAPVRFAPLVITIVGLVSNAQAQVTAMPEPAKDAAPSGDIWRVMGSAYTYHFSYSAEHRHVYMLGLEKQRADDIIIGGSAFTNSFGQPSLYLYGGKRFYKLTDAEPLFVQVTGGLLYGYKPPYDKKVPLNYKGFSPGAVLSVGWQFTPMVSAQVNFLGNSALMFQVSADFR